MAFELVKKMLNENGDEQLIKGSVVVNEATGEDFESHSANAKKHIAAEPGIAGQVLMSKADGGNQWTALESILTRDAMIFKGVLTAANGLPDAGYEAGWTYKVGEAGTYAGNVCEVGDLIVCVSSFNTTANNADWAVVQSNIDGAVTGPVASVSENIVVFDGVSGKLIKDSAITKESISSAVANSHAHDNSDALAGIGKNTTSGNLTFNNKELTGETGIALIANEGDTPVFTGKIRMVVAPYTMPSV